MYVQLGERIGVIYDAMDVEKIIQFEVNNRKGRIALSRKSPNTGTRLHWHVCSVCR